MKEERLKVKEAKEVRLEREVEGWKRESYGGKEKVKPGSGVKEKWEKVKKREVKKREVKLEREKLKDRREKVSERW